MKCLGFTNKKDLRRCRNPGKPLFCALHSRQPLVWLFAIVVTGGGFVFSAVGGVAVILPYFGIASTPLAERKAPIPEETNSPPSRSRPSVLPSPNESPTLASTPAPKQADNLSSPKKQLAQKPGTASDHINRARALLGREQLVAALAECNKALGLEPGNRTAIDLKNSINDLYKLQKQKQ